MYCKHCANEIDEDVIICPKCGKQVQELKRESATKSVDQVIENKDAWYYEWWFIILMCVLLFPVGLILLVLKLANK